MIRERLRHGLPGIPILIVASLALAGIVWLFFSGVAPDGDGGDGPGSVPRLISAIVLFPLWIFLMTGALFSVR